MRYKSEFKIPNGVVEMSKGFAQRLEWQKESTAATLGKLIAEKTGWQQVLANGLHLRLEVQCMSWEDWQELKRKISELMPSCYSEALERLFRDSESKGVAETENKIHQ